MSINVLIEKIKKNNKISLKKRLQEREQNKKKNE
jgi:hypothetical protein